MRVLVVVVALVIGGLLGTLMMRDPGYLLIAYGAFTFESSLWFAVLAGCVGLAATGLVVYSVARLLRGRSGVARWFSTRRLSGARQQTVQGLLQMAEGRWADAKKALVGAVSRSETPLINYLNAARAAHELDDVDERDRLLKLAHETTPSSRFAVALTQAQLQRDKGQWEQCLATLIALRKDAPRHAMVLAMLADCYRQLEDWESLQDLVGDLRKHKVLDPEALRALQIELWRGRLARTRGSGEAAEHAENTYREVPKDLRNDPALIGAYVEILILGGAAARAEAVLRGAINAGWNDEWVRLYGRVQSDDPGQQLVVAQAWLKERPNNATLLLTLGRLSLMNRQWRAAREYFETSLRLARSAEVYGELGRLCVAMGETQRGTEYLSQSLERAGALLPDLPLPD